MKRLNIFITNRIKGDKFMEYAKDEIFSITYNKKKDRLEYSLPIRMLKSIKQNKFITLLFTVGGIFGILDFIFIYYFFRILSTI